MSFEKKHYNYGEWTKGRFSEVVAVTGPSRMLFLAGIGAEDEQTGETRHKGDFSAQLRYAYKKLKTVLEKHGAGMHSVVKQVTYVTDARHLQTASKIRLEEYGDAPLPAHTFLNVTQLAFDGMLVEIDITAAVPLD
jgi:enamine deaminase RidA (YjgF/YER057c/UK114 family)